MTNEERREKLAEIFGQQAEYFEEWFCPETDFDERDAEIARFVGKPVSEVRFGDVFDYIDKERPELAKEFKKCIMIAKDAQQRGRVWTTGNPLKTIVSRKDISVLEAFTIYVTLCDLLKLGRDK